MEIGRVSSSFNFINTFIFGNNFFSKGDMAFIVARLSMKVVLTIEILELQAKVGTTMVLCSRL